jgi:hypothetical protein
MTYRIVLAFHYDENDMRQTYETFLVHADNLMDAIGTVLNQTGATPDRVVNVSRSRLNVIEGQRMAWTCQVDYSR